MSYAQRFAVNPTTAANGVVSAFTPVVDYGEIDAIIYTKDGSNPYSNGVSLTVTGETTGVAILTVANMNASAVYRPRIAASLVGNGAASTLTEVGVAVVAERVKLAIASGGNATVGAFSVIVR